MYRRKCWGFGPIESISARIQHEDWYPFIIKSRVAKIWEFGQHFGRGSTPGRTLKPHLPESSMQYSVCTRVNVARFEH